MSEELLLWGGAHQAARRERRDELADRPLNRAVALALAIALAVSVVLSSFTIAADYHHECTGDGCVVCAEMTGCLHIARVGTTLAGLGALALACLLSAAPRVLGEEHARYFLSTLVHLKVQLND